MSTEKRPFVAKTPLDIQKQKLEKLMANPDKPVVIPIGPREKKGHSAPEFVRNVMGSSAGAGSGEFHVYRHLRRKEYTRQKVNQQKADKEKLDEEFLEKIESNKRKMEERAAKNRAKRLKKKSRLKSKPKIQKETKSESDEQDDESTDEDLPANSDHHPESPSSPNQSSPDANSAAPSEKEESHS